MQTKLNLRLSVLALIVLAAAMSRLLPHPPNVTAVGAMTLFGGAYFSKRWQSIAVPLVALWLSDLILNNVVYKAYNPTFTLMSAHTFWSYVAVAVVVAMSWTMLKKVKTQNVILASVAGSMLFYLITNFGAWFADPFNMYSDKIDGLAASYTLGLPFLMNSILGDLVWCGVLFGGYEFAKKRVPALAV